MKKFLITLLSTCLILSSLVACSGNNATEPSTESTAPTTNASAVSTPDDTDSKESSPTDSDESVVISLAADQGGINDKAINEGTYIGMKRAEEELGIELKVIESRSHDDYEPTMETLVSANSRLIVGVGTQMTETLVTVSKRYPDIHFISMDSAADSENVKSYIFKEQEGSFMAGVIAGLMTKTNRVGFIGGKDIEAISRFESGFAAGVMCVNPEAGKTLLGENGASGATVKFADSFSDSNKAYELAKSLYSDGCDIIYHAAGGAGIGLFQATKEAVDNGSEVWAIGVDQDQAAILPEFADVILTSMVKKTGEVVYTAIEEELAGKFEPGVFVVGIAEKAVGLADSSSNNVPQNVLGMAEKASQMVQNGQIKVPGNREELNGFQAVEIQE